MKFCALLIFAASMQLQLFVVNSQIESDLVVKHVERTIDIASQLIKITAKISMENLGKTTKKSVLFALEPSTKEYLSHISVLGSGGSNDEGRRHLEISSVKINEHKGKPIWQIELRYPLEPGKTTYLEVETVFSQMLIPYPSQISQSERQEVLYHGNHYFYSPYPVVKQTTNVVMASSNIESYTKFKPVSQSDNSISYGPYENVAPFSVNEMSIHYENNSPFLTVTNLERSIEVSHWGNIALEESIDLRHTGAILKGPFSRYEYQRDQNGVSSVKSFKTVLPAAAKDVYYRDEIGNISTSHLRVLEDAVELDLRPRFPLFGGWKTKYVIGYNLPSYEYLYNSGDHYVLKMRFVDHIFDDMIVDHATVKVILPEGAKDIKLNAPFEVQRQPNELHYTYLDTTGRPVVVATKKNMVENHIQEFELHYSYQKILMFQEPLLVVLAFYLLFILVIIYVRLDFSITKDEINESKMRVSSLCEKVQHHHDKRLNIFQQFDSAINHFKSNKDLAAFQAIQKKLGSDHKAESQAVAELLSKMKQESAEAVEKVNELQKLDKQMKEQIALQIMYAEKLIAGKMKKDQYIELEQSIIKKKDDMCEKMEALISAL